MAWSRTLQRTQAAPGSSVIVDPVHRLGRPRHLRGTHDGVSIPGSHEATRTLSRVLVGVTVDTAAAVLCAPTVSSAPVNTCAVTATIPVTGTAEGIPISSGGSRDYVTHGEEEAAGQPSVIDTATNTGGRTRVGMRGFSTLYARAPLAYSQRSTVDSGRRRAVQDTPESQACRLVDQEAAITSVDSARQAYRTAGCGWQRGSGPTWAHGHGRCPPGRGRCAHYRCQFGQRSPGRTGRPSCRCREVLGRLRSVDGDYFRWHRMTGQVLTNRAATEVVTSC